MTTEATMAGAAMDELLDLFYIVAFIVWIIWKVVQGSGKKKERDLAEWARNLPGANRGAAPEDGPAPPQSVEVARSSDGAAIRHRLRGQASAGDSIDPVVAGLVPIDRALARVAGDVEQVQREAAAAGRAGGTLTDALAHSVVAPLGEVTERWAEVRRLIEAGTQVTNLAAHIDSTVRWVRELGRRLGALRRLVRARVAARDPAAIDDADAIAASFLAPYADFMSSRGLRFPAQHPIAVPVAPGSSDSWGDAVPGHPIIGVPTNFGDDLFWWTSVPHAMAHLIWDRTPGLAREVVEGMGLEGTTRLLDPAYDPMDDLPHRLVRAWMTEIFADALTILLAGPPALHGMMHAFDDPRSRVRLAEVAVTSDGFYDSHPPAQMRVGVAVRLLSRLGYDIEGNAMARLWEARHPEANVITVPLARRRSVEYPLEPLVEYVAGWAVALYSKQFRCLSGHSFESISGFTMGPGMWRRVRDDAANLELADAFHDQPRLVVAAAMEARHHNPAAAANIRRAARAAILGAHAPLSERSVRPRRRRRSERSGKFTRAEFRDALVLLDVVERRSTSRRPESPRFSGRPAA